VSAIRAIQTVVLLAAVAACAPDDQRTDTMNAEEAMQRERESLPVEVVAQLDSGGLAIRGDDYEAALAHYTRATEIAPGAAAGWFGVYMAQQALGNETAAREALDKAQAAEPGATLIHPTRADTLP
jgi:tetratricopeptide (TPR) repeat protein